MSNIAFIDTETLGLNPDTNPVWEIAVIVDGEEYLWQQRVTPHEVRSAAPSALEISGFSDRYNHDNAMDRLDSIDRFANLVRGCHLAGAVVSFDEERLRKQFVAHNGFPERFPWHYHLIDVEALAIGFLSAARNAWVAYEGFDFSLPWKSDDLSEALGVTISEAERHTALGDARWAKHIYEAVTT